jgi:hypothetical protein
MERWLRGEIMFLLLHVRKGEGNQERTAAAFPCEREVEGLDWAHPMMRKKF